MLSATHNQVDLARRIAVAAPHSGAFLQAIPMSMIGIHVWTTLPSALQLPFDSVHRSAHHTSAFVGPPSKVPGCMVSVVGNQAVGLPDIQPSMGSSKPPYRQLRFRQDSNHKVWFTATTKDRMEFRQCRGQKVDVWLETLPAQTLWLQVISTVQFLVHE